MKNDCCNSTGMQWQIQREDQLQVCGETTSQLPAGGYTCSVDCSGRPVFMKRKLESDSLIDFPGSFASQIVDEVSRFWPLSERFQQLGFLHRRGYLFYGKQGGGKSSIIHQIVSDVVAAGNVVFFCGHPAYLINCLTQFRKVEPERPLVCVFEDIEAIIEDYGDNQLLQWLDGNHQVGRAINLATTNYPEKLDRRIIARPRRFDRIIRIESPCERMRAAYLTRKLPEQSPAQRERWVAATAGFSFAAMSELMISVLGLDNDFDETIERLRKLDVQEPSSNEFLDETVESTEMAIG